jgi:hypothetical protein
MSSTSDQRQYEERLATFGQRRTAAGPGKTPRIIEWPHETPTPEQLARAGYVYRPTTVSTDNVECVHCRQKFHDLALTADPSGKHKCAAIDATREGSEQMPDTSRQPDDMTSGEHNRHVLATSSPSEVLPATRISNAISLLNNQEKELDLNTECALKRARLVEEMLAQANLEVSLAQQTAEANKVYLVARRNVSLTPSLPANEYADEHY